MKNESDGEDTIFAGSVDPKFMMNPSQTSGTVQDEVVDILFAQLHQFAKFKDRSNTTHDNDHAPVLAQCKPITCLLLGDSMLERFKTTGQATKFGLEQAIYPEIFNAGVGGDRICNVIFRLTDKGLLSSLRVAGVKHALLEMGTNDLVNDKKPLQDQHIEQYSLVIQALQWACPGIKILVCGLNPRKRVAREGIVEESNERLRMMVQDFVSASTDMVVEYMPSNPEIINHLEDDNVHLNEEGYRSFGESLWEHYQRLRAHEKKEQ